MPKSFRLCHHLCFYLPKLFDQPHLTLLRWLEAESNLSLWLTLTVDAALWLAPFNAVDMIFWIGLVLSFPLLQLDMVDLNLKLPITAFRPLGVF